MDSYKISGKLVSSYEKVVNNMEIMIEIKKDGNQIKMRSLQYHKDAQGEKKKNTSVEWEKKKADWSKNSDFSDSKDQLNQIRKGEEWYFKFPTHDIWWFSVGTSTGAQTSFERSLDVTKDEKYGVSIIVRGEDSTGNSIEIKKDKTLHVI